MSQHSGPVSGLRPQAAALSSAYFSAFNDYARRELHYGEGKTFKL